MRAGKATPMQIHLGTGENLEDGNEGGWAEWGELSRGTGGKGGASAGAAAGGGWGLGWGERGRGRGGVRAALRRPARRYHERGELTLACWCAPQRCHAEVIREAVLGIVQHGLVERQPVHQA